jgi:putative methyltransferase (TIGR04325 family)
MAKVKNLIRDILPPALFRMILKSPLRRYGWFGNYPNWQAAQRQSIGYDSTVILERVKNSLLKVKNDEAVYERDSVLFDHIEYDWPVLAGLMWVAAQHQGRLSVLDFGGSLGSSFYQNRKFLATLKVLEWSVVEQAHFVETGIKHFQDNQLQFFITCEQCLAKRKPNVILLSSVLSYIEKPYELLEYLSSLQIEFIIVDRLPVVESDTDQIKLQKINPLIYPATYPAWYFSKSKFLKRIVQLFDVLELYNCQISYDLPTNFIGLILKRNKS